AGRRAGHVLDHVAVAAADASLVARSALSTAVRVGLRLRGSRVVRGVAPIDVPSGVAAAAAASRRERQQRDRDKHLAQVGTNPLHPAQSCRRRAVAHLARRRRFDTPTPPCPIPPPPAKRLWARSTSSSSSTRCPSRRTTGSS